MIYHVSVNGCDQASGTAKAPFRTINHAAQIAKPGDTVKVHEGTYREWIDPKYGGTGEHRRIVYEAAEGEHAVIKGSEAISGWEHVRETVWKKTLPNEMFGNWNPYAKVMDGDWFTAPRTEYNVHLGDVYINGISMYEAASEEDLYSNLPREKILYTAPGFPERIAHPEMTIYKWRAEVDETCTTIYGNFQQFNPNRELIEINVRPCCFYPRRTGINFITLRGFEIAQAACPWIPPTTDQIGMVGPHWSRGWIIENNDIHDAKCSAVTLGKEASTGDDMTEFDRKSGHRFQLEAVFNALRNGWSKETVGSHIVRNNEIHDCGQNGIVGHMGCIFSYIYHNHVYNIGTKYEFCGSELAGIKFHAAIDTILENNNIHDCTLGTWLDWQAQGTRVTGNIYHHNDIDFEIEVSHGPCLIDNNIFLSPCSFQCYAQGNALVHNLFTGNISGTAVRDRSTPYHFPHSTIVAGYSETLGGDDRLYNNIFGGMYEPENPERWDPFRDFSTWAEPFSTPEEFAEGIGKAHKGDLGKFFKTRQPVWFGGNGYSGLAKPSRHDKTPISADGFTAEITENNGVWKLHLNIPKAFAIAENKPVTTQLLGETRLSAMAFEAPDGSDVDFSHDILGEERGASVIPGPFASLRVGEQIITVWDNKKNV